MSAPLRVLFITKDYPPHLGGMARYSDDLYRNLSRLLEMKLMRHSGVKMGIPLFAAKAFCLALFQQRQWDALHVSCGMLAPIAFLLKQLTGKPATVTVHGLDIVRKNWLYRQIVPRCLKRVDRIVAVSINTKHLCQDLGIDEHRISVIPNGIDFDRHSLDPLGLQEWRQKYGICPAKKVLFTVGNLTQRKGQRWFVENVLGTLGRTDYQYFIIGDGKDRMRLDESLKANHLETIARATGPIARRDLDAFFKYGDLYIMPNIPVDGDVEGFGIVAIEAAASGVPVLTSGIEGIADSVVFGVTGERYNDAAEAKQKIAKFLNGTTLASSRETIRRTARNRFNWKDIAQQYCLFFSSVSNKSVGEL